MGARARTILGLLTAIAVGMLAQAQFGRATFDLTDEQKMRLAFVADHIDPAGMSVTLPDGRSAPEVVLTGVNLRTVNGRGHTNIVTEADRNGLGNIFAGYGEPIEDERQANGFPGVSRVGIHGIGLGRGNDWTSYAWLDVGKLSNCWGSYCAIASLGHTAYEYGTAWGGVDHIVGTPNPDPNDGTAGFYGSCFGGRGCRAPGYAASGHGGIDGIARGQYASFHGGDEPQVDSLAGSTFGGYRLHVKASAVAANLEGGANRNVGNDDPMSGIGVFSNATD